jgi:outer membrane protein assembly factor BamB
MTRRLLWRTELRLDLQGGCIGAVGDEAWLFICARTLDGLAGHVIALDPHGRERWRHTYEEPGGSCQVSVQPHYVAVGQAGQLVYGHTRVPGDPAQATRHIALVDPAGGFARWTWVDPGAHGLNRDVALLPDGGVLAGPHDCLVALDPVSGAERWRYADGVRVCWGASALADLDGNGCAEIVFGTEWGSADGSSALIALTTAGEELWRREGFVGDLGSTATFDVDVDGDGQPEIAHVELDLEGRVGLERSRLLLLDRTGALLAELPFGGAELAVADWDDDGHVEAVGATVRRDGGCANVPEIVCLDLTAATVKWRTPLPRWWLANWPVLADLDGDGWLEAVVGAGNPNGYGRLPGEAPWGDLYVLRCDGSLFGLISRNGAWSLCQLPLPSEGRLGLACLWGDGRVELHVWE